MTAPTFTKECLRFCVRVYGDRPDTFNVATENNPDANIGSLAAFALALLEQSEADQRELVERGKDIHTLTCALESERERAEKAEAMLEKWETEIGALMPEDFKDWHENAIEEHPMVAAWCLKGQRENTEHAWEIANKNIDAALQAEAERDRLMEERRTLPLDELVYGTRAMHEVVELRAERDRLRAQLDSILANSDSLESGKLADAHAENKRLREELEEAEARALRNRVGGMLEAAEVVRKLRPKEACTCGNYLDFRNGVPGHLPGCLVGECIDAADEIDGRAEEIARGDRE